ncbi:MAG TPA: alpha-L-rhamnosidase C-terminal domain-containing protein, partial [Puia sp.]|nr:alpha-L-rhamnosidase C-terminal domain-containing protein [Puia sp.]
TTATLLVDQGFLTNAYPHLRMSGGAGATVSLTYAEALYSRLPVKGNRSEVEGKFIVGRKDSILADGRQGQEFTTLSWRTFRYLQIRVVTGDQPLAFDDLYNVFTGYPFEQHAKLETADPQIGKMLEIGWRTARLCAVETYMDCPYYEQLQYIGDTRIQALVSLYNSGDDRLVKNAIEQLDESRLPEGVTLSRYPSRTPQLIPTFSLWWIGMLHDYWMYGRDTAFAMDKLPGERQVLDYFHRFQREDGSLRGVPYWAFTDWVDHPGWESGMAPAGADGSSSVLDLQLLWAYQLAAEMEARSGLREYASAYRQRALQLKRTIRAKYWVAARGLLADRPEKDLFSQHANALAILTGVAKGAEAKAVARRLLSDTGLAQASIYFKYYLHQALIRAGYGNDYLQWLGKWREDIAMGLTTWAEMSDVSASRSDCHAWGASPNIEFFRTVLGIDSDAPGFTDIRVEPHPGELRDLSGEMPHPNGTVTASYRLEAGKWTMAIGLPPGTKGHLIWHGAQYALKAGMNHFDLR